MSGIRDPERLAALRRTGLLDSDAEPAFDRLTELAARMLRAPVSAVSLVDDHRQFFKSCVGIGEPWRTRRETPISLSFCQHVVRDGEPLIVEDARRDPGRFAAATEALGVVAYVGVPLLADGGHAVGTICVADRIARRWTLEDVAILRSLGAATMSEIELRTEIRLRAEAESELRDAKARLDHLLRIAPAVIFTGQARPPHGMSSISPNVERLLGHPAERFLEDPNLRLELVHPEDRDRVVADGARLLERDHVEGEYRYLAADGTYRWLRDTLRVVRDETGDPIEVVGASTDVTERREAQDALRESEERFRKVFDDAPIGMAIVDLDRRPIRANAALCEMLGYEERELREIGVEDFTHPDDLERGTALLRKLLAGETDRYTLEKRYVTRNGDVRWGRLTATLLRDAAGAPLYCLGIIEDVTEHRDFERRLQQIALYDGVTGLPNRNLFRDRLDRAVWRCHRDGGRIAMLFLGLDRFKLVNDSLGYVAGDQLLAAVANRVSACVPGEQTVARLGGDEFAVLLESGASEREARELAGRIQTALRRPFSIGATDVHVTTSIGIALGGRDGIDESGVSAEDLLRFADMAMYTAKKGDNGRYHVFDPSERPERRRRLYRENEVRRAVENDELRLYFQPIVALETGATVGAEALVRWAHPERGLLPPADFIPLAEDSGLIVPLGEWVVEEASRRLRAWRERTGDIRPFRLSVNLSAAQFRHAGLPELIERAIDTCGSAADLQLEITETLAMTHPERIVDLHRLGVSVAIDDFGTGFSSLASLERLAARTLKIDRTFVAGVCEGGTDRAIVRAILLVAEECGLDVIAEGIEEPGQLEELVRLGCELGQGFHFARPMAADHFWTLLGERRLLPCRRPSGRRVPRQVFQRPA